MTNKLRSLFLLCALLLFAAIASAAVDESDTVSGEILARLRKAYPATQFDAVRPSEIPGVYEVTMGRNLAYVEPQGRYFLFGHLYDLPNNDDITARREEDISSVAPNALPPNDAFVVRRSKNPKFRLTIFSDPKCGYCRGLEETLSTLPEIEVTVYLLPLQDGAEERAASVWCAPDRAQAWQDLMLKGASQTQSNQPSRHCDTDVFVRNRALASRLGIHGTPAIIAGDGRLKPGAMSRTELLAWLSRSSIVTEPVSP